MRHAYFKILYLAPLCALGFGSTGWTQVAGADLTARPAQAEGLGDIIVTATRRSERLQDVPIAVTAVTAAKLDEQQIVDVTTLAKIVPGMQVKPNLNRCRSRSPFAALPS
jgi:iron complex outermembrane receptor protein